MWIRSDRWEQVVRGHTQAESHLIAEHARNVELERTNAFLQTSLEWMRGRINQLEFLSARLTEKEHGIPMGSPVVGRTLDLKEMIDAGSDLFSDPAETAEPEAE